MNSATKVGEIFTKAGDSYNKIGDMIVMLHPAAQELMQVETEKQQQQQQLQLQQQQQQQQQQQVYFDPQQQQLVVSQPTVGTTITLSQPQMQLAGGQFRTVTAGAPGTCAPTYVNIGGQTAQLVNGVLTIPQQQPQPTYIKTEVLNQPPLAVQQIQVPDVAALLDAAVSQTEAAGFITSDPPIVANEEEITHVVHTS